MAIATGEIIEVDDIVGLSSYRTVEAGENITAGNVVYINQADGKAYVSDTGTANDIRATGIALDTATTGNDTVVQTCGFCTEVSGLTGGEIYYLGASGALSTTRSGVRIGRAASATELTIEIIQDDRDVVGTIKAWHKSMTGMPSNSLTAFWVECDGSTLSDTESPFNGQTVPDLNGDHRFLRGNDTSGDTGGTETHTHSNSTGSDDIAQAGDTKVTFHDTTGNLYQTTSATGTLPTYYGVVWIIKVK